MKRKLFALVLGLCLSAAIFAFAKHANATLGESADSIESDRDVLSAVRHAAAVRNGYTVEEVDSGSTIIREYISPAGVVFAIAWNGLIHPDLDQLLGSYIDEYRKALQQTPRTPGQRHIQLKTDRIVVEKWGHMRNLQGRAYDPALIPSGVSIDEIK